MSIRDDSSFYDIEKRILISFITDTAFCYEIFPILDYDLFSNDYSRRIVQWAEGYFNTYGKSPKSEIEIIYHQKKSALSSELQNVISTILEHLSEYMDSNSEFNTQHSITIAKDFFTSQILQLTSEKILSYLEKGQMQEAKELMQSYKGIPDMEGGVSDSFSNKDLTDNTINKIWYPEDSNDMQLIGRIGEYLGSWENGWLIAFMAPMKRGKTHILTKCAFDAVLKRKKALFVSLEMPDKDMNSRAVLAVTAMTRTDKKTKIVPIFDCVRNQKGSCDKFERTRKGEAIGIPDGPEDFYTYKNHRACSKCRETNDFKPSVWYKEVPDKSSPGGTKKIMNAWEPMFDQYLRTKSFPADTASTKTLEGHMDHLLKSEGFDTEILIVDYADLLTATDTSLEYRHRLDGIWKSLKSLAHKRNILVITASQTNRGGMSKAEVESSDASEDIRKVAIVDAFYALNQSKEEKKRRIMRIGFTDARFTDQYNQCCILQDLKRGQFCLDSEF